MAGTTKTGYCNGSDMLLQVAGKAVGHSTTHTTTFNTETKERAVKPVATAVATQSLWKGKGVVSQSISISAEGLHNYDEGENGFKALLAAYKEGKSVDVACFERGDSETPYLKGKFVIASLEQVSPAQDDATYSVTLENDGAPEVLDASVLTDNTGEGA